MDARADASERWWLWGVLGGTLLFAALVLVVHTVRQRQGTQRLSPPQQVLWDYITALQRGDYDTAYTLLSVEARPEPREFHDLAAMTAGILEEHSVEVGPVEPVDEATVRVRVTFASRPRGFNFFGLGVYTFEDWARLRREDGQWRILDLPGPLSLPRPLSPLPGD